MKKALTAVAISTAALFIGATVAHADEAGPVIEELEARVSLNTVRITWTTDVTATGKLEYGKDPGTYTASKTTEEDTEHRVTLKGLDALTTYYYRITVTDDEGNATQTEELSFITQSTALQITRLEVIIATATKFAVVMETNKSGLPSLRYGSAPDALTKTARQLGEYSAAGTRKIVFVATGLEPNTSYYYQASSGQNTSFYENPETAISGIGLVQTTKTPKITFISPTKDKVESIVTIHGVNFGDAASKSNGVLTAVAFGCILGNWPDRTPTCLGEIVSWSDTEIVVKVPTGARTGPIYIGKAVTYTTDSVRLFVKRSATFTVKK